jgi:hypothetical protein
VSAYGRVGVGVNEPRDRLTNHQFKRTRDLDALPLSHAHTPTRRTPTVSAGTPIRFCRHAYTFLPRAFVLLIT